MVFDRYFCSYWQMAMLRERGADGCARMHQRRKYDFRRGQRLGAGDHVVEWCKPARPRWMDEETYAARYVLAISSADTIMPFSA